jgi:pimeloyl-ACP methyl ester carboxylesterase
MAQFAASRCGAGDPLVLLHGLGSSSRAWDPVVPDLAAHFEVVAVDLAGFGGSGPLPAGVEPTPAALAAALADYLDEVGIAAPHVAGNSLGGWVSLELAALRPVSSVTLLGPAGLWRGVTPRYARASLRLIRWLATHAAGPLARLVKYRLGRLLVLGQTHGRPMRMPPAYARMAISAMGDCPGFEPTYAAMADLHYQASGPIDAPVTVGFGSRDLLLLPWQSRHVEQLPPGTRVERLPRCGHVPMADDPAAIVTLIRRTAARANGPR